MSKEICSCGFPQSHPIPHEHDQTDREKAIVAYYSARIKALPELIEALKAIATETSNPKGGYAIAVTDIANQALKKAGVK